MLKRLVLMALLGSISRAGAGPLGEAASAFDRGAYAEARKAGLALHSADGFALAARAEMVLHARDRDGGARRNALLRAEELARKAIAAAPGNAEAHLTLAAALGLRARVDFSARLAIEARRHIETARMLVPKDMEATLAWAVWNMETRLSAGPVAARFLGASLDEGEKAFDAVRAALPGKPGPSVMYAHALLRLDMKANRAVARALLRTALETPPQTALDAALREDAERLLAALDGGDDNALKAALDDTLPYKR